MHQDVKEILYTQEQLATRVRELGAAISKDYANDSVILVGVLKGAIVFYTDLVRTIDDSVDVSFDLSLVLAMETVQLVPVWSVF